MSADNGVYILRTKRTMRKEKHGWAESEEHYVWRVVETTGIEDFEYFEGKQNYNLGCYIYDTWKDSPVFLLAKDAYEYAVKLARDFYKAGLPLEYGISSIDTDYIFWGDH